MKPYLILLGWLVFSAPLWAQNLDPLLRPTQSNDPRMMTLVERQALCSAGLQSGGVLLELDDQVFGRAGARGLNSARAVFGCRLWGFLVGYGFFDDAYQMDQAVTYDSKSWNLMDFHHESLQLGYGFSLWSHRLIIDAGLSFYQLEATLGRINGSTVELVNLPKEQGLAFLVRPVWYVHPYFYLDYTYQTAIKAGQLYQNGQWVGAHYWMRF